MFTAGQAHRLFAKPVTATGAEGRAAIHTADIKTSSYPWLNRDTPTFAVKAYLISQRYTNPATRKSVRSLTQSLCRKLAELQQNGHPKWKQVSLTKAPLPGGWEYSEDAMEALNSSDCHVSTGSPAGGQRPACTQAEILLMTPGCSGR